MVSLDFSDRHTPESYLNTNFASLGLAKPILRAVERAGHTEPTPIQALSIPHIIDGDDLLASAQTGTGKTASFALPIIHKIITTPIERQKPGQPRALILTPTRELAVQVEQSVRSYNKETKLRTLVMYGGTNIGQQINALKKPVDILVATPGRLLDHVQKRTLNLSAVETLVLDEADRMLDMGFIHDIRRVFSLLPDEHQSLLFSATFSNEIKKLAKELLHEPQEISVTPPNSTTELVSQNCVLTKQSDKRDLLSHIIRSSGWHQVLVFTRTKHGANKLAEKLAKDGLKTSAIHGNKSQAARNRALESFKKGKLTVLVATDIAARGLDIDNLPQVINFELPNVPEDYVHRIGRTGRAGRTGASLSLVDKSEIKYLRAIERLIQQSIDPIQVEGWESEVLLEPKSEKPKTAKPKKQFAKKSNDQRKSNRSSFSKTSSSNSASGKANRSMRSKNSVDGAARPTRNRSSAEGAARPTRSRSAAESTVNSRSKSNSHYQGQQKSAKPARPVRTRKSTHESVQRS